MFGIIAFIVCLVCALVNIPYFPKPINLISFGFCLAMAFVNLFLYIMNK